MPPHVHGALVAGDASPPAESRAEHRAHGGAHVGPQEGPPNPKAVVELAGATGALAGVINGLYEPAGPRVHERPAYRKQGGGDVWVCCGRTGRWWVTDAAGKGGASGWARSLHGICFTLS